MLNEKGGGQTNTVSFVCLGAFFLQPLECVCVRVHFQLNTTSATNPGLPREKKTSTSMQLSRVLISLWLVVFPRQEFPFDLLIEINKGRQKCVFGQAALLSSSLRWNFENRCHEVGQNSRK